jgi:hypothetical protein
LSACEGAGSRGKGGIEQQKEYKRPHVEIVDGWKVWNYAEDRESQLNRSEGLVSLFTLPQAFRRKFVVIYIPHLPNRTKSPMILEI